MLMRLIPQMWMALSLLGFTACTEGPDGTVKPIENPEAPAPAVEDSMLPLTSHRPASPIANLGAPGEIAFGSIWFDGTKQSGTSNWTSTFNATSQWYEITITGESYFYTSYATVVTPNDARLCRTGSVSGKLLVICTDTAGTPATSRFGFVTFKQ
jgi:hypothetical protein